MGSVGELQVEAPRLDANTLVSGSVNPHSESPPCLLYRTVPDRVRARARQGTV
jgi:hypothetical protein